ncbi:MAG: hypothetical protein KDA75_13225, partial [Planctomycetaceae bacterium]|nr:hypothetical protein [Planctomycetaceae bacterium]
LQQLNNTPLTPLDPDAPIRAPFVPTSNFEQAVYETASRAAERLFDQKATAVVPKYEGFRTMAGGGGAGFAEIVKEGLAFWGIKVAGKADYALVSHLEWTDGAEGTELQLVSEIVDGRGQQVGDLIRAKPTIVDGRELAEILGVPVHFGPQKTPQERRHAFFRDFDDPVIYTAREKVQLASHREGLYRFSAKVNGEFRPFDNRNHEGLAFTQFALGDTYTLVLTNNSNQETAVEVKIDGLNVFHFSDPGSVRPDGTPFRYWIVKPHGTLEVKGWHKNDRSLRQFKVTPVEDGAAVQAGVSLEDVGLVTATFYASWTDQPGKCPHDEPQIVAMRRVEDPGQKRIIEIDGRKVEVVEQQVASRTELATGFGTEILYNGVGVNRVIGVPRATLAFRYDR